MNTETVDRQFAALQSQADQTTTTELLQAIHGLVDDHVASVPPQPVAQPIYSAPAGYAAPPQYQQPASGGGLQRFLSGRFGQAMVTGAGIGIGDDIVNSIFDRF